MDFHNLNFEHHVFRCVEFKYGVAFFLSWKVYDRYAAKRKDVPQKNAQKLFGVTKMTLFSPKMDGFSKFEVWTICFQVFRIQIWGCLPPIIKNVRSLLGETSQVCSARKFTKITKMTLFSPKMDGFSKFKVWTICFHMFRIQIWGCLLPIIENVGERRCETQAFSARKFTKVMKVTLFRQKLMNFLNLKFEICIFRCAEVENGAVFFL